MADEPTNIALEHLRRIDRKADDLVGDMRQVILRLGSIERHMAGLNIAEIGQNAEIDRIKERLERVERRLELTDR
jgi:tetrahydromethanopterin S-methyltransferase subunit G